MQNHRAESEQNTTLENAALALGGKLTWNWSGVELTPFLIARDATIHLPVAKPWNPIKDSGDCLELAVALKIMHRHLTPEKNGGNVVIRANDAVWIGGVPVKKLVSDVIVSESVSEIEATRLAICNVAGLMGRAIK